MEMPHGTFVVVADGEKMLFLRNEGDDEYPNLELERKRKQDNPPDREQKANRRGRTSESTNNTRYAYEETDFHQLEEDRFAVETAELLKKRALENDYDKLIVVAPPRTLGEMRQHYHVEVKNRLLGEIDKDLTGHPLDEIEKIVSAA